MRGPPIGVLLGLALLTAAPAGADSFTTVLHRFTGADAIVRVTLDDEAAGPGKVQVSVEVIDSAPGEGLESLALDLRDDSLLSGLVATGRDVAGFALGAGANDLLIEFGSQTLGWEEVRTATIVLSHLYEMLDLTLFAGEEVRVRLTGGNESSRVSILPEPATAWLLAAGLAGLSAARRRRA